MTFKSLTPKQTYIVSIAPNEEIVETLTAFVKERGIRSGYVIGIGAVKSTRVASYSAQTKRYTERKLKKPLELVNLTGIITTDKVHLHATYASHMFKGFAGHLVKAVVAAACEIIVVETVETIGRKRSEEVGLDLLDLRST